jgi:hypothetical protein
VSDPELHAANAPISFLLGTWRGRGAGRYPNIDDFSYEEEVRFWQVGRPFLMYQQRTWSPESGVPMHSEMGYWRPQPDGSLEVVLAHGFGVIEIERGNVVDRRIELSTLELKSTPSAKVINALARTFEVAREMLTYEVQMAYGDVPLQHHLGAELQRITSNTR